MSSHLFVVVMKTSTILVDIQEAGLDLAHKRVARERSSSLPATHQSPGHQFFSTQLETGGM
jgi:hypothetical protein